MTRAPILALLHRYQRRLLPLAALCLVLLLAWLTLQWLEPKAIASQDQLIALAPASKGHRLDASTAQLRQTYATSPELERTPIPPDVDTMRVGLFVTNNYSIDMAVPMYASDGLLWSSWSPALQAKFEAAGMAPTQLLSFVNSVEGWDGRLTPVGNKPLRLANGDYYQLISFSIKLSIEHLGLRHYPFQTMHLPVMIEVNDDGDQFRFEKLRLIADHDNSGVGRAIDVNGFITRGWSMGEFRHIYASDFGLHQASRTRPESVSYSQILFDVVYARSVKASVWSLFQPLLVVMAIVILSPSLSSRLWDVRIALPATAVLTLVFLQASYRNLLPQLPYLTFIDRIYSLAYAICLACFALYVWAANRLNHAIPHGTAEQRVAIEAEINRVDFRFQLGCLLALSLGSLLCWML